MNPEWIVTRHDEKVYRLNLNAEDFVFSIRVEYGVSASSTYLSVSIDVSANDYDLLTCTDFAPYMQVCAESYKLVVGEDAEFVLTPTGQRGYQPGEPHCINGALVPKKDQKSPTTIVTYCDEMFLTIRATTNPYTLENPKDELKEIGEFFKTAIEQLNKITYIRLLN